MKKGDPVFGFKDPTHLWTWTKRLLYASVAWAVVEIIGNVLEYQILTGIIEETYPSLEFALDAAGASDALQGVLAIVTFMIFLTTGILVLKWIYRANYNARQLGAMDMTFTPSWSIGWYFIPVVNLWKPYRAMKEIWHASANPKTWKDQRHTPSLLPWWWCLWIISNMIANASMRLGLIDDNIDSLLFANVVRQVSSGMQIVLILILLRIIHRVHHMQMTGSVRMSEA